MCLTTSGRAIRNSIDLLAYLTDEEASQIGREFFDQMGWLDSLNILNDVRYVLDKIKQGIEENLPK